MYIRRENIRRLEGQLSTTVDKAERVRLLEAINVEKLKLRNLIAVHQLELEKIQLEGQVQRLKSNNEHLKDELAKLRRLRSNMPP